MDPPAPTTEGHAGGTRARELAAAYGSLLPGEVAALDAAAMALGVEILQLMEIAGLQVARAVWARLGGAPGDVFIAAGRGNNGGDGLAAARLLDSWGCAVRTLVAAGEGSRLGGAVARQLAVLQAMRLDVVLSDDPATVRERAQAADLCVDALLGTGLRGAPRDRDAAVIEALCHCHQVLSVDVPSGLDAAEGSAAGACVTATATVTLTAMKRGLWRTDGASPAGELWVADIGMPAEAWRRVGLRPPTAVHGGELLRVPAITP